MTVRMYYELKINLNTEEAALFEGFSQFGQISSNVNMTSGDYDDVPTCIDKILEFFEEKNKLFSDSIMNETYTIVGVQHPTEENHESIAIEKIVSFLLVNDKNPNDWILKATVLADKTETADEKRITHRIKQKYLM
jgi:hypothetical protein